MDPEPLPEELPEVSVIVPFFNQHDFVEEALSSILAQNYPKLEVLLINDGSDQPSIDHLADLSPSIRILHQENAGPSAARNHGIREAQGEIIAFLDSDDVWPNGKLPQQLAPFLDGTPVDMTLAQIRKLTPAGELPGRFQVRGDPFYSIQLGCLMARRSVFDSVGLFDEGLKFSEDQDWFLRAREQDVPMLRIACLGLHYRSHPASLTRQDSRGKDFGLISVLRRSLKRRKSQGGGDVQSLLSISNIPEWSG